MESLIRIGILILSVFGISITIAIPILVLIYVMEKYDKYKKNKEKEVKELDRIIIKKNEDITTSRINLEFLDKRETKLMTSIYKLEEKLQEKIALAQAEAIDTSDIDLPIDENAPEEEIETINYNDMTIKELQDIARELKIKGFSRMSKKTLIEKLPVQQKEQPNDNTDADNVQTTQ